MTKVHPTKPLQSAQRYITLSLRILRIDYIKIRLHILPIGILKQGILHLGTSNQSTSQLVICHQDTLSIDKLC